MSEEQNDFLTRTAQRLAEESGATAEQEDLEQETPPETAESEIDAGGALSETEEESTDLEDETPEDEPEVTDDWEARYKELQAEYSRATEHNTQRDEEVALVTEEFTRGKFELEDAVTKTAQVRDFLMQMVTNKANQARQVNFAQLPPDQVQQAQQWVQQALAEEQQFKNALADFESETNQVKEQQRQREALVSRRVLQRQIPNFDEAYPDILRHMVKMGVAEETARNEINPATIRAFYDSMTLNTASSTVETVKQTKAKPPKSKQPQHQARGLDGRFKKADQRFREASTSKDRANSWEEKTRLRLAKEGR